MLRKFRRYLLLSCLSVLIASFVVVADSWMHHAQTLARPTMQAQASDQSNAVQQATLQYLQGSSTVPARVNRTAISGNFALTSWVQGETGGTALLKKEGSSWQVVASGGGVIGVSDMEAQGVPRSTAENLLTQIDPNWRTYSAPQ